MTKRRLKQVFNSDENKYEYPLDFCKYDWILTHNKECIERAFELYSGEILEALRKQVPVKPLVRMGFNVIKCPKCKYISSFDLEKNKSKYCENCGQRFDLTELDEWRSV